MSRSDEIRSALGRSGEPMLPREVADALGAEGRKARSLVAAQVSAMAKQDHGIERLHDGRYSLVPGWVKARDLVSTAAAAVDTAAIAVHKPLREVASSAVANPVADRILEHLRGDAAYDVLQLLRDAREEIMQLDCAARIALMSANNLSDRLRAATQ